MEILMKLKCSPAATSRSPHSTLKVVDHHHQLQQQHVLGGSASHVQSPLTPSPAIASVHDTSFPLPPPLPISLPSATESQLIMPGCLEYATATTMDCCSVAQQDMVADLPWERPGSGGLHRGQRGSMQMPGSRGDPVSLEFMHSLYAPTNTQQNTSPSPLNLACCPTFEPPCCAGIPYRMTSGSGGGIGGVSLLPSAPFQHHIRLPQYCPNTSPLINANPTAIMNDYSNHFMYQEPDENFVSIDDAKVKGFLMRIGEKEQQRRKKCKVEEKINNQQSVIYEIIELDDEEQPIDMAPKKQTELSSSSEKKKTQRTEIRESKTEKIVASIDLVESSTDSEADGEEELPLAAAAAVSCELQCDGDNYGDGNVQNDLSHTKGTDVVVLNSDDEENVDFINEQEEGIELRGDELEENRERAFFECFLCGKKVQSSYNLRRHMMIHTGERPFGCDLCERRFREFSDLKKHRRRHILDPNFACMICRINTPSEHDPTRCLGCDSKSAAALAAIRPQVISSPEISQTPPSTLRYNKTKRPPSRHLTPTSISPIAASPPLLVAQPPNMKSPSLSPSNLPPLTPIASITRPTSTTETQLTVDLDTVPGIHRSEFHQQGVITRKAFPCPLCQRPFGTRHNLKRHFMIHTGEKPFNCSKCRKPFREYSTLKKHMVTHKRERYYKCHFCAYKSLDYLDYNDHKNTHPKCLTNNNNSQTKKRCKSKHGQFQDDSYEDSNDDDSSAEDCLECCECGQNFTDIEIYTEHLKEHDPTVFFYECYICTRTFAERESLANHLIGHDNETKKQNAEIKPLSIKIEKSLEE